MITLALLALTVAASTAVPSPVYSRTGTDDLDEFQMSLNAGHKENSCEGNVVNCGHPEVDLCGTESLSSSEVGDLPKRDQSLDPFTPNGPNQAWSTWKRHLDTIGGGNLLKRKSLKGNRGGGSNVFNRMYSPRHYRNLDTLDGSAFGLSKRMIPFDEFDRVGSSRYWIHPLLNIRPGRTYENWIHPLLNKRPMDEIDRAGFNRFSKRPMDEIDRAGFNRFSKRPMDEIDRAGFNRFNKRSLGEDQANLGQSTKRNMDEIDNAGFNRFHKRNQRG